MGSRNSWRHGFCYQWTVGTFQEWFVISWRTNQRIGNRPNRHFHVLLSQSQVAKILWIDFLELRTGITLAYFHSRIVKNIQQCNINSRIQTSPHATENGDIWEEKGCPMEYSKSRRTSFPSRSGSKQRFFAWPYHALLSGTTTPVLFHRFMSKNQSLNTKLRVTAGRVEHRLPSIDWSPSRLPLVQSSPVTPRWRGCVSTYSGHECHLPPDTAII